MAASPGTPARRALRMAGMSAGVTGSYLGYLVQRVFLDEKRRKAKLQAAHGLSLAEYDALLQIAHAPGRRVRMNVLAERVILSRSGITRLVDRPRPHPYV